MEKTYVIQLSELDLVQILAGLESQAELWERTRDYLESGELDYNDGFIIAECSKLEEAIAIANYYRSILNKIQNQMDSR